MKASCMRRGWVLGLVEAMGCLGDPRAMPLPLEGSESMAAGSTGIDGTSTVGVSSSVDAGTSTIGTSTGTGPIAECGNGELEAGEDCDGTDLGATTCESLGYSETGLACVGCQLDVSGCGPVPGMVAVPGGAFEMGSNDVADEQPIRQVEVDAFWMDETEVTVAAYSACVEDGVCSEPNAGGDCNWMMEGREDHPVSCVTWFQAEDYCGWAEGGTKRLPTEAEWEKAARGTDAREYPWGDSPGPTCSHVVMHDPAAGGSGCGMTSTWPVGSKPLGSSPYGAHDMAGNVWEWVADWYAPSYDAAETDNPTGPAMGTIRVARGSSWYYLGSLYFRAASRFNGNPAIGYVDVGFRCARTPPAPL